MKGGMIFQLKVCAIGTSKIKNLCVRKYRRIIQEICVIQQHYPHTPPVPKLQRLRLSYRANSPLLCKGNDFSQTDVVQAV